VQRCSGAVQWCKSIQLLTAVLSSHLLTHRHTLVGGDGQSIAHSGLADLAGHMGHKIGGIVH
jgi:hypothetical protein